MANVDQLVKDGIAAIKAGRKADARRLLEQAIEQDEKNEQAWLYLSGCVDTPEEQQICLENVLTINPKNEKARKGMDALNKVLKKPSTPPAPAASDPFGGSGFDSNPFAGTGFDSNPYGSGSNDPAVGKGWGTLDTGGFDLPSTSVDWNQGSTPAYGSGKDVNQPSADEYDNWVAGLSLPGSGSTGSSPASSSFDAPSPFDSGFESSSGPFGSSESSFDFGSSSSDFGSTSPSTDPFPSDPFKKSSFGPSPFDEPASTAPASDPFGGSDPFGSSSDPFGGPFGDSGNDSFGNDPFSSPAASDPFGKGASKADPFADAADPFGGSFSSSSKGSDPFSGGSSKSKSAFAPQSADPLADLFSEDSAPGGSSAFGGSAFTSSKSPSGSFAVLDTGTMNNMQSYFKAIPAEIKGKGSKSKLDLPLVVSLVILLILNIASIGLLVHTLMPQP